MRAPLRRHGRSPALAVDALDAAASTPNASLRSAARLVQALAHIVLGPSDPNGALAAR